MDLSASDRDQLIRTIYGEAAGEPPDGQAAVAHVILNRLQSEEYPDSIGGIVHQRNQFSSWTQPGREANPRTLSPQNPAYNRIGKIVDGVASGDIPDPTGGALNFANVSQIKGPIPAFAKTAPTTVIGNHSFFNPAAAPPDDMFAEDSSTGQGTPQSKTYVPVSSGGGVTVMAPRGQDSAVPDDMFADDVIPTATAQTTAATAPPLGLSEAGRAIATGVPIIGGILNPLEAATNAALSYGLNPLFAPSEQLTGSFGERYSQSLAAQNAMDIVSRQQHPIASTVLGTAGAIGGMLPAMMAAPAAFGLGATEATLPIAAAASGATGAGIGGLDAFIRSGGNVGEAERGAITGGLFGGMAVPAGYAAGALMRGAGNLLGRTTPAARFLASRLSDIGITPQTAASRISAMGPQATLMDIDPSLSGLGGILATKGGVPTSVLKGAMAQRTAAAGDRISNVVDQNLGQRPDITALKEGVVSMGQKAAEPFYSAARANPTPMTAQPVVDYIDSKLPKAVGGLSDVLNKAKSYLVDNNGVPWADSGQLLAARQAMDDYIERLPMSGTTVGKNAMREAVSIRQKIDSIVKQDQNIATGDAAFALHIKARDAIEEGENTFKPSVNIEDLQRSIGNKTPTQVEALRQGTLSVVHNALDNARQGEFSAARSLFGKSTANRAKLEALFPNAKPVLDEVNAQMAMRETETTVARGSQTAERMAMERALGPTPPGPIASAAPAIIGEAVGGAPGAFAMQAGAAGYHHVANALAEASRGRLATGLARGLAVPGTQNPFLSQIARAYMSNRAAARNALAASALTNLLTRQGGTYLPRAAQ